MVFIFSYVKKIFLNIFSDFSEPEHYTHCLYCGKELTGSRRKFCSNACNAIYWRKVYSGEFKRWEKRKEQEIPEETKKIFKLKSAARALAYKKYPSLENIKCEICKIKNAEHRHHEDYDKPLEVNFLCWSCHGKVHGGIINIKNTQKRREKPSKRLKGGLKK